MLSKCAAAASTSRPPIACPHPAFRSARQHSCLAPIAESTGKVGNAGSLLSCNEETTEDYDAGLCYPKCRPGFHGVGPVLCSRRTLASRTLARSCTRARARTHNMHTLTHSRMRPKRMHTARVSTGSRAQTYEPYIQRITNTRARAPTHTLTRARACTRAPSCSSHSLSLAMNAGVDGVSMVVA
jgi:hypothetical protein